MNIFLDSSVVLAASMSAMGASREVFNLAGQRPWRLLASPWVLRETKENLANKSPQSISTWIALRATLSVVDDELAFDWPVAFEASKDKPVLFSALSSADVLLIPFLGFDPAWLVVLFVCHPERERVSERESKDPLGMYRLAFPYP